jgi:hypothetical protein
LELLAISGMNRINLFVEVWVRPGSYIIIEELVIKETGLLSTIIVPTFEFDLLPL